ncbi:MAG: site-specific tyrosine recombinase/integron integrase [Parachlamydiaceae bacterium]
MELCDQFLDHLKIVKNASEHTIRNYRIDLTDFQMFLEGMQPNEADRKTIRSFLSHLHAQKKSKRTIARKLSSLRTFFKFLHSRKIIPSNPTEELESPKIEKKVPASITYDQVVHLFNQPDTSTLLGFRDRTIMELFYSSGIRLSELASLELTEIDFSSHLIKVQGKGKKERIVPITQNAALWLQNYIQHPERNPSPALFLNRFGNQLTPRSIDRMFHNYLMQSGLSAKITPHTIRHTIATHWLENSMDLKTIQEILGHASLSTTTIYTQVSTKLKKSAYDEAHPRAHKGG